MFASASPNKNIRILTGDRPTGKFHLGHLFGLYKNASGFKGKERSVSLLLLIIKLLQIG